MTSTDVSIIIPSYNRADIIAASAKSALQNNPRELIVVDDSSHNRERYRAELDRLAVEFPASKVTLLRNRENLGASRSRLVGLRHAVSEFVLFLDDDILLAPGYLECALPAFEKDTAISAVTGQTITVGSASEGSCGPEVAWSCNESKSGQLTYKRNFSRYTLRLNAKKISKINFDAYVLFGWNPLLWRRIDLTRYNICFYEYLGNGYREETDPQIQIARSGKKVLYKHNLFAFHVGERNDGGQWGKGRFRALRWFKSAIHNNNIFLDRHGKFLREHSYLALPVVLAKFVFAVRITSALRK